MKADPFVQRLQIQYGLNVLRLSLDRSASEPHVLFDVSECNRSAQQVEPIALLQASLNSIGLLASGTVSGPSDSSYQLPDHVAHALSSFVANSDAPGGAPLWLAFGSPCGLLPAVPWERPVAADTRHSDSASSIHCRFPGSPTQVFYLRNMF